MDIPLEGNTQERVISVQSRENEKFVLRIASYGLAVLLKTNIHSWCKDRHFLKNRNNK